MTGRRAWALPAVFVLGLAMALSIGVPARADATGAPSTILALGEAPSGQTQPAELDSSGPTDTGRPDDTVLPTPAGTETASGNGGPAGIAARFWWLWAVLALVAGWLLGRGSPRRATRRSSDAPAPAAAHHHPRTDTTPGRAPGAPATSTPDPRPVTPASEIPTPNAELVEDLILGHDLARDEATADHLEHVLARLGVTPVRADPGTAFDSTIHHAVGTEDVTTNSTGPVIVRVQRPGWHTATNLVRHPEVIVSTPDPRRTR